MLLINERKISSKKVKKGKYDEMQNTLWLRAMVWFSSPIDFSEDDATLPKSFRLVPSERIPFSEGFDC